MGIHPHFNKTIYEQLNHTNKLVAKLSGDYSLTNPDYNGGFRFAGWGYMYYEKKDQVTGWTFAECLKHCGAKDKEWDAMTWKPDPEGGINTCMCMKGAYKFQPHLTNTLTFRRLVD